MLIATATATTTSWTDPTVIVPVLVSLLALGGVVFTNYRTGKNLIAAENVRAANTLAAEDKRAGAAIRAEDYRVQLMILSEVQREGRRLVIDALESVSRAVELLRAFNVTMSGNTGEGEDDTRSAEALEAWAETFKDLGPLNRQSLIMRTLGHDMIEEKIANIRNRMATYALALGPPTFSGTDAVTVERDIEQLFEQVVELARIVFQTDEAWKVHRSSVDGALETTRSKFRDVPS